MAFINEGQGGDGREGDSGKKNSVFAWRMFQAVVKVLRHFGALDGEQSNRATALGDLVASLSADNELWLALVLTHPRTQELVPGELASLVCACTLDSFKAQNAYFSRGPSEKVSNLLTELEPMQLDLKMIQTDNGIEYPINLSGEAAGMVESWAEGSLSWRDLCKDTSLDQGDVCRILRRTVEALRQLPNAMGVPEGLAEKAIIAANGMDRFPVADEVEPMAEADVAPENNDNNNASSGQGFGLGLGNIEVVDDKSSQRNGNKVSNKGKQFDLEAFLAEEEDDEGNTFDDTRLDLEDELFKWSKGKIGMAKAMGVDLEEEDKDEADITTGAVIGLDSEAESEREKKRERWGQDS